MELEEIEIAVNFPTSRVRVWERVPLTSASVDRARVFG